MNRLIIGMCLCLCVGLVGCGPDDQVDSNRWTANNEGKMMSRDLFRVIEVEANGEVHEYLSRFVYGGKAFCHLPNCKFCKKGSDK